MFSQFRIRLFDIEPRQDQGDEKVKDHGHPQIHDVQHVYGGSRLFSRAADVAAESQKPAGQSGPDAAAVAGLPTALLALGTPPTAQLLELKLLRMIILPTA